MILPSSELPKQHSNSPMCCSPRSLKTPCIDSMGRLLAYQSTYRAKTWVAGLLIPTFRATKNNVWPHRCRSLPFSPRSHIAVSWECLFAGLKSNTIRSWAAGFLIPPSSATKKTPSNALMCYSLRSKNTHISARWSYSTRTQKCSALCNGRLDS